MKLPRRQQKQITETMTLRLLGVRFAPALLILLCVTLMIFDRLDARPAEKLQTTVTDIMAPTLAAVSQPFVNIAESFEGLTTLRTLKAENIRLREENEKLRKWYETALKTQAENLSFKELLNVKADANLSFVTARVVSDPGGAFVKSVLLPVGARDHVGVGSAVMSGQGLVGRVTEVGEKSSRVLLATDLNSRIPVVIQNTRTRAILAGKNSDILKLERFPADSGVSVGNRVVTSGDGGQLPPDIPVGTIIKVGEDGVFVKLLSDTSRMTHVQVINAEIDPALSSGDITPQKK